MSSILYPLFLILILLPGCGPSYPKKNLEKSLPELVKKEYGFNSTAHLMGRTIYLEVVLSGLTSTDSKALTKVLNKVQGAMLSITRAALSSDAKVEYMVVTARDVSTNLNIRLIQRLSDVKGFLFQKISRSDYEGRLILEIESSEDPAPIGIGERYELTQEEFIGRLIISQINMASRTNPFLSVLLNGIQLRYSGYFEFELLASANIMPEEASINIFRDIVVKEAQKTVEKYKIGWTPKTIKITSKDKKPIEFNINQPDL